MFSKTWSVHLGYYELLMTQIIKEIMYIGVDLDVSWNQSCMLIKKSVWYVLLFDKVLMIYGLNCL